MTNFDENADLRRYLADLDAYDRECEKWDSTDPGWRENSVEPEDRSTVAWNDFRAEAVSGVA